jgi:hypothetical protein
MSFTLVITSNDFAPYKRYLAPNASPKVRLRIQREGTRNADVPNKSSSIQMLESAMNIDLSSCPTPKSQSKHRTVSRKYCQSREIKCRDTEFVSLPKGNLSVCVRRLPLEAATGILHYGWGSINPELQLNFVEHVIDNQRLAAVVGIPGLSKQQ